MLSRAKRLKEEMMFEDSCEANNCHQEIINLSFL